MTCGSVVNIYCFFLKFYYLLKHKMCLKFFFFVYNRLIFRFFVKKCFSFFSWGYWKVICNVNSNSFFFISFYHVLSYSLPLTDPYLWFEGGSLLSKIFFFNLGCHDDFMFQKPCLQIFCSRPETRFQDSHWDFYQSSQYT